MHSLRYLHALILFILVAVLSQPSSATASSDAPIIRHRPLTSALKNQTLSVRAEVIETSSALESVTLHFSTSADSAPFKVPMKHSGASKIWAGSIPAAFLQGHKQLSYYIAAENTDGVTTETPWHKVRLYTLSEASKSSPASSKSEEDESGSWVKPTLIAGGVAVVAAGVAVAVSGGGGGGGGDDSSDSSTSGSTTDTAQPGTYAGTATTCFTITDTDCETHMFAITISEDGYATSDTLVEREYVRAPLNGNEFTFIVMDSTPGRTGEITYSGTVLDDRIIGSVSGAGTSGEDTGSYSGTFNATRQP